MVIAALVTFGGLLAAWIAAPSTERQAAARKPSPAPAAAELVAEGA
jgi:hypothetical protein